MTEFPAVTFTGHRRVLPYLLLVVFLSGFVIAVGRGVSGMQVMLGAIAVVAIAGIGIARFPLWGFIPLTVLATAGSAVVRSQLLSEGSAASLGGLLGQGRIVVALAALALLRLVVSGHRLLLPSRAVLTVGLYVVGMLISVQVAVFRGAAAPDLLSNVQRELSYVGGGFLLGALAMSNSASVTKSVFRWLAFAILSAAALNVLFGLWQSGFIGIPQPLLTLFETELERAQVSNYSPGRVVIPFVELSPNEVAVLFAALAAFATPPLLRSARQSDTYLALAVLALASSAVLATGSRTGIIVVALVAASHIVTSGRPAIRRRALIILAIGVIAVVASGRFTGDRALSASSGNVLSREAIWGEALNDFAASPIIGHGFEFSAGARYFGESVHHEYLGRLVDGGLIGGATFIAPFLVFGHMGWVLIRRKDQYTAHGIAILTFMAVLAVSMLANASWSDNPVIPILSWLFFGMTAATWQGAETERRALRSSE